MGGACHTDQCIACTEPNIWVKIQKNTAVHDITTDHFTYYYYDNLSGPELERV